MQTHLYLSIELKEVSFEENPEFKMCLTPLKWKTKSSFHIEDFESLFWANEGGPIWEMIVSSPISDKNFDDSKSSKWKSV